MCFKLKLIVIVTLFVAAKQIKCADNDTNSSLETKYSAPSENTKRFVRDVQNCLLNSTHVATPIFVLCLLAVTIVLMFLVIMYLIFVLHKLKAKDVERNTLIRQDSSISTTSQHNRLLSGGTSPGIKTGMTIPLIQCEEIMVDHSFLTPSSTSDINQNATSTTSLNNTVPKIYPHNLRNPYPNSILPDQMKRICEEALVKKNYLNSSPNTAWNEITKIMNDIELRPNNYSKGLTREKSVSTPQLDVYDTLPAPVATTEVKEATVLEKANSTDEVHNREEKCDSILDNLDADDIYDCPPSAKKYVIVEDSDYSLPITSANSNSDLTSEPSYINAKKQNFIL